MFKITPVSSLDEAKAISESLSLPYFDNAFYYKMFDMDTEELMGACAFEIHGAYGEIYALCEVDGKDDFEAMFILGRQTLNFINLCGGADCIATDTYSPERLLLAIGFQKDADKGYRIHLDGMFDGHCHK